MTRNNSTRDATRGFTLIELLVVIAIIGVLASTVLASLGSARVKARDTARVTSVKALKVAMEMYFNDNGGYPTSNGSSNGDVLLSDAVLVSKLVPKYIAAMPANLLADNDHFYANGVTTGVYSGYELFIYMEGVNAWCRAGTLPGNTTSWGTPAVCNF